MPEYGSLSSIIPYQQLLIILYPWDRGDGGDDLLLAILPVSPSQQNLSKRAIYNARWWCPAFSSCTI